MSIRRIGGGNPFVSLPPQVEAERRVEAVEKYVRTGEADLESPEELLQALQQAELAQLDAEQAAREQATQQLRAKLLLADGYEPARPKLVELKGEAEEAEPGPRQESGGLSLAQLARASVYAAAQAREAAEAQAVAALVPADFTPELSDLEGLDGLERDAELEALEGAPDADAFFASLDDIAHVEGLEEPIEAPDEASFYASLDDIAHLLPAEATPEAAVAEAPEVPVAAEASEPVGLPFSGE